MSVEDRLLLTKQVPTRIVRLLKVRGVETLSKWDARVYNGTELNRTGQDNARPSQPTLINLVRWLRSESSTFVPGLLDSRIAL